MLEEFQGKVELKEEDLFMYLGYMLSKKRQQYDKYDPQKEQANPKVN